MPENLPQVEALRADIKRVYQQANEMAGLRPRYAHKYQSQAYVIERRLLKRIKKLTG